MDTRLEGRWKPWKPLDGLAPKYRILRVLDCAGLLQIDLVGCCMPAAGLGLELRFGDGILAYRVVPEVMRSALIAALDEAYTTAFYATWSFFTVEESEYAARVTSESRISHDMLLTHFAIVGENMIFDIVGMNDLVVDAKLCNGDRHVQPQEPYDCS